MRTLRTGPDDKLDRQLTSRFEATLRGVLIVYADWWGLFNVYRMPYIKETMHRVIENEVNALRETLCDE